MSTSFYQLVQLLSLHSGLDLIKTIKKTFLISYHQSCFHSVIFSHFWSFLVIFGHFLKFLVVETACNDVFEAGAFEFPSIHSSSSSSALETSFNHGHLLQPEEDERR